MAMQDFSRSLPMMLYRALDAVMPRFRRIFGEFGLTEQQWRVLRVLWERDTVTLGELSRLTLIAPPSLVGVIDRLGASGLLERRRSRSDRRVVHVGATAAGRELEQQVMPRVQETYAALRDSLPEEDWSALIDGLERVARLAEPGRKEVA